VTPATRAVLHSLAAARGQWVHGYDLLVGSGLQSGSLYPILQRLAERGFLDAEWERSAPPGRPARHLYRLTATGEELVRRVEPAAALTPPWVATGLRGRRAAHAGP
jgi:DNA-binding PadR family transcriptional regulator